MALVMLSSSRGGTDKVAGWRQSGVTENCGLRKRGTTHCSLRMVLIIKQAELGVVKTWVIEDHSVVGYSPHLSVALLNHRKV